jgi:hypothetical protein
MDPWRRSTDDYNLNNTYQRMYIDYHNNLERNKVRHMYRTSKAHDKTDFLGHGKGPNYSIAAAYKGERIKFF